MESATKTKANGHTLLVHSISYVVDAGLYLNLPYDPDKSFVAVAPLAIQPFALVASPPLGVKSVAELTAKGKAGSLKFASFGPTTQLYFIAEQFRRQVGIEATNLGFKSLAEGNAAVAKGEAAFWLPPVAGVVAGVREARQTRPLPANSLPHMMRPSTAALKRSCNTSLTISKHRSAFSRDTVHDPTKRPRPESLAALYAAVRLAGRATRELGVWACVAGSYARGAGSRPRT